MRRLSRRAFIRSGARAGLGAGALALVGCSAPETYNERRDEEHQAPAPPPARQAESVAEFVEQQEEPAPPPAPVRDPLLLRRQNDWRGLRDATGGVEGPRPKGDIVLSTPGPRHWSPITPAGSFLPASSGPQLLPLLYSQLITLRVDDETDAHRNTIEGDLASSWEVADGTMIVFHLREDVRWPEESELEGRALTASDVAAMHERFRGEDAHQRAAYRTVTRIEADDAAGTVAFRLSHPTSFLLTAMTAPDHVVLPPDWDPLDLIPPPSNDPFLPPVPVPPLPGTGPFEFRHSGGIGSTWSLTRRIGYFKQDPGGAIPQPYVDTVNGGILPDRRAPFQAGLRREAVLETWADGRFDGLALESGDEIDAALAPFSDSVLQVAPPVPRRASHVNVMTGGETGIGDPRARRALSKAIDREVLAARWHGGFADADCGMHWPSVADPAKADGFREWPWSLAELGDGFRHDPAAAAELLAAAGYGPERPLPLIIDSGEAPGTVEAVLDNRNPIRRDFLIEQWRQAFGDAIKVEQRDLVRVDLSSNSFALLPHEDVNVNFTFGPFSGGAFAAEADPTTLGFPSSSLSDLVRPPDEEQTVPEGRRGAEDDAELDALWERQERTLDPFERSEILEQIRAKRAEHMLPIYLVNSYGLFVRRGNVYNLGATYFAHNPLDYPKQLERTWKRIGEDEA